MSLQESLERVRAEFGAISQPYYCNGIIPLEPSMSTLFYSNLKNGQAESINFTSATDSQLTLLAEACQPATFGLNDKDILDESYRKAGKMDVANFSSQFSPWTLDVIDTVQDSLSLLHHGNTKSVRVELYKLNVYGPGSFFKAHVDTPHSETMVGSLVIVLPTVHEGGSLIIRHDGQERIIDTAQAVNSQATPHAAFVAFYSDVEHEVALVTSGYRVTLTYNLYVTNSQARPPVTLASHKPLDQLKNSVDTLLNDPTFLPQGGFLGFVLSHKYPFKTSGKKSLSRIPEILKGSDAEVKQVCEALGLNIAPKALYSEHSSNRHPCCLVDHFVSFDSGPVEMAFQGEFLERVRGCKGSDLAYPYDYDVEDLDEWMVPVEKGKPIIWIKPFDHSNAFKAAYVAHGNQALLAHAYGNVCLVAVVGRASDRIPQPAVA